ncbi:MAG: ATP-binding cassette domain-containing protein [Anaerolineales bacterium]
MTFHYPASTNGIENISMRIKRGSLTVITGRIGSGKTTLLRTLLGLLPADLAKSNGMEA